MLAITGHKWLNTTRPNQNVPKKACLGHVIYDRVQASRWEGIFKETYWRKEYRTKLKGYQNE